MSVCLSCSGNNINLIYDFGNLPAVNSFYSMENIKSEEFFPMVLNVCNDCYLVQIENVPSPEKLYKEYHHKSSASSGNVEHLENFKDYISSKYSKDTKILEIGSNDSTLLNLFYNDGFNCVGIDPAENLNSEHENVISDFFNMDITDKVLAQYGRFDLIFGLNVFAHNDSFIDMFKAVNKLLETNGTFIFDVAYAKQTILKGNFDTIYHEHVCSYTLTSLINALSFAEITVVDVEELPSQGGSLRLTCKKSESNYEVQDRVNSTLKREIELGYQSVEFYENISNLIENKVLDINNFFEKNIDNEKRILFIGAPARGVVVLNLVKNLDKNKSLVIDDTPEKQNKMFPGKHIAVKGWENVEYNDFDMAVVLSWNYVDYLEKKLRSFGFNKDVYTLIPEVKNIS